MSTESPDMGPAVHDTTTDPDEIVARTLRTNVGAYQGSPSDALTDAHTIVDDLVAAGLAITVTATRKTR